MDTVFLDTSIFIKENFLAGKKINQLLRLAENGHIEILITPVTIGEVKSVFQKWVKETEKLYLGFKKNTEVKALWNTSIGSKVLVLLKTKEICLEFNSKFDEAISNSQMTIVDYATVDIKDIFEKYFSNSYPFNGTDKKSEFPDAVVLKLLESWCDDNKKDCIVFSTDGDFLNYKHPRLTISADYDIYLSDKLTQINKYRAEILDKIYVAERPIWHEAVKARIDEELEEWDKFSAFVNDFEIHDVSDLEVKILRDSYTIVQLTNDENEIKIEVTMTVEIKANIVADDPEFTYYDSDDKSYHYFETATVGANTTEFITCILSIFLISEDDNAGEFTIEEFNEGEPLSLTPEADY